MSSSHFNCPLVAVLDGRDCSIETAILKGIASVAFCKAENVENIHDNVFKYAVGAFMWHTISLTKEDLEKFKSLRLIVRLGDSVDNIDCKAAGELGIAVCNVPGYGVEEMAESTMCHILNLYRRNFWLANIMTDPNRAPKPEEIRDASSHCLRIRGETLGIVGLGRIGMAVALRAKAFGFNVIFFDPFKAEGVETSIGVQRVYTLQELLFQSDCISLHCTLNKSSENMINMRSIRQMRPGAFLVNTARGKLVNEKALADALRFGNIRGAAIDVYENESHLISGDAIDNIDCKAAGELGIAVCNVPGCSIQKMVESTMCHILNLYRRSYWLANLAADGKTLQNSEKIRSVASKRVSIRGNTLGIVGLGRVGTAVALQAKAFGFNVIFYDPNKPDGAFLVNPAHGNLVIETALAAALKQCSIRGAAIDVFKDESYRISGKSLEQESRYMHATLCIDDMKSNLTIVKECKSVIPLWGTATDPDLDAKVFQLNKTTAQPSTEALLTALQGNTSHLEFQKRTEQPGPSGAQSKRNAPCTLSEVAPLVAVLDAGECGIEKDILRNLCTLFFCDAASIDDVHEKVLAEAVAVFVRHSFKLSKSSLEKFKMLRLVIRAGDTVDFIDCKGAGELGIAVSNVPSYGIEEIADTTMCHILALYRRTFWVAQRMSSGVLKPGLESPCSLAQGSSRLSGSTLGIVGMGRVGLAVACRAKAMGMKVIFFDPHLPDRIEKTLNLTRVFCLRELLASSDCVSLHCMKNIFNRHLINEHTIHDMKKGSYLVNTAQGGLVDEAALAAALKEGHLSGAALDVFENEPFDMRSSPLNGVPNLLCTPHTAWCSEEATNELRKLAAEELKRGLVGTIPASLYNCVNAHFLQAGTRGKAMLASKLQKKRSRASLSQTPLPDMLSSVSTSGSALLGSFVSSMDSPKPTEINSLLTDAAKTVVADQVSFLSQAGLLAQLAFTNQTTTATQAKIETRAPLVKHPRMEAQVPMANHPQMAAQAPIVNHPQMATQAPPVNHPQMPAHASMVNHSQISAHVSMINHLHMASQAPMINQPRMIAQNDTTTLLGNQFDKANSFEISRQFAIPSPLSLSSLLGFVGPASLSSQSDTVSQTNTAIHGGKAGQSDTTSQFDPNSKFDLSEQPDPTSPRNMHDQASKPSPNADQSIVFESLSK
ncbi:hypothetical protein BIW11_01242 [Tropilaelaps mercedesae]|uniref:C-terminal-binding protein-like n=1 Tax=Tropilaelaps mercedesae TaxID=418985 RepID=A0A1V9XGT9_9ACAR|nr:hypothetical protein BIW11_01242 [Tropilaelaps mercedesae]